MHQYGSRNVEDLTDAQQLKPRRGPVLALDFGNIGGMDSGLVRDLLLREMGTAACSLDERRKITWTSWVLSHRRVNSSPRGLALESLCLMVIFVTLTCPSWMRQAQNLFHVDRQSYCV